MGNKSIGSLSFVPKLHVTGCFDGQAVKVHWMDMKEGEIDSCKLFSGLHICMLQHVHIHTQAHTHVQMNKCNTFLEVCKPTVSSKFY